MIEADIPFQPPPPLDHLGRKKLQGHHEQDGGMDEAVKLLSMLKKNWPQNHSTGHGYMHILLAATPFSGFHSIQDPNSKSASRILPSFGRESRPIYLKYRMLVFTNGDYVLSFSKQRDTSLHASAIRLEFSHDDF